MTAPVERIVVGVDGSRTAQHALTWALAEAAARRADLEVVTACPVDVCWTDPHPVDRGRLEAACREAGDRARALVDEVRQGPAAAVPGGVRVAVRVVVAAGAAAAHLVDRSAGAALLVVGGRGRGADPSTLAGSVALHCAAHARCPVVVVHPEAEPAEEPARVVVGLDDSEQGRSALLAGVAHARRCGAVVDVVVACAVPNRWSDMYAVMAPPTGEPLGHGRRRGEEVVAEVLGAVDRGAVDRGAVDRDAVRVRAVEGFPGPVLVTATRGARLLVVGSCSRRRLEGVTLGSVALHCVVHAPCPVLVVRPGPDGRRGACAPPRASNAPPGPAQPTDP